jgi:hypothetical protein
MKTKTNEKALADLMKELKGTIHSALIRERLLKISEMTRDWAEKEIAQESQHHFIAPELFIELCNKIDKNLKFEN